MKLSDYLVLDAEEYFRLEIKDSEWCVSVVSIPPMFFGVVPGLHFVLFLDMGTVAVPSPMHLFGELEDAKEAARKIASDDAEWAKFARGVTLMGQESLPNTPERP